jgi:hypothetical protein
LPFGVVEVTQASICGDDKAGRDIEADLGDFAEVSALAAE